MSLAHRLSLVFVVVGALCAAADEPPTLKALVGEAEYQAMGLGKLSAEQQDQLVRWIQRRIANEPVPMSTPTISFSVQRSATAPSAAAPAVVTPAVVAPAVTAPAAVVPAPAAPASRATIGTAESFGLRQDDVDGQVTEIRARVVGEFKGWDGQTVFRLDNGQVWRQAITGTYRFKATDPEVVIEKSFLGYKLRLVETHRSIPVRRIK